MNLRIAIYDLRAFGRFPIAGYANIAAAVINVERFHGLESSNTTGKSYIGNRK